MSATDVTAMLALGAVWEALVWVTVTELSYFGPKANPWVYMLGARLYRRKYRSRRYAARSTHQAMVLDTIDRQIANNPGSSIADLACGPGRVALRVLANPAFRGRVLAVDASVGMIRMVREARDELLPELAARLEIRHGRVSSALVNQRNWS